MEVMVICLGTPRSARDNIQYTSEYLGAPETSLGAHQISVEQSGKNIIFGNSAGVPGNHRYYLSFSDW